MGWFKKKKEEISEQELKLPELQEPKGNLDFPSKEDLLKKEELPLLPEIKEDQIPKPLINSEMQQSSFEPINPPSAIETESIEANNIIEPPKRREFIKSSPEPKILINHSKEMKETEKRTIIKKAKPIYVRLDKFEVTVESFDEIKNKIIEIEQLLKKAKEIKSEEEKELEEWENEIQSIKTRIDAIDKNIFSKID